MTWQCLFEKLFTMLFHERQASGYSTVELAGGAGGKAVLFTSSKWAPVTEREWQDPVERWVSNNEDWRVTWRASNLITLYIFLSPCPLAVVSHPIQCCLPASSSTFSVPPFTVLWCAPLCAFQPRVRTVNKAFNEGHIYIGIYTLYATSLTSLPVLPALWALAWFLDMLNIGSGTTWNI